MIDLLLSLLKALGLEKFVTSLPKWAKAIIMVGIMATVITYLYFQYFRSPSYIPVTVNFSPMNGKLREGTLSLIFPEGVDIEKDIQNSGQIVFDSVPEQYKDKPIYFNLISTKYQLKKPEKKYFLNSFIKVEIEEIPANFIVKVGTKPTINPKRKQQPKPAEKQETPCPLKSPNGTPLNQDQPVQLRKGYKWIAGNYKKVNGNCVWVAGSWEAITINDCPKDPPAGYTEPASPSAENVVVRDHTTNTTKSGNIKDYEWIKGHWELRNGECTWVGPHWASKRKNVIPAATYVPPPNN